MAHLNDLRGFSQTGPRVGAIWSHFSQALRRMVKQMQHARMMAVLNGMSDARLAVAGISRDEISEHAAYLVGLK